MTKIPQNPNPESVPVQTRGVMKKPEVKESLFNKIDTNKDGKISEEELYNAGYQAEAGILREAIFMAERTVNKWFTADKNKNGSWDNVELSMWDIHNYNETGEIEDYTKEEFAQRHNLEFDSNKYTDMGTWLNEWITDSDPMGGIKASTEEMLGRKLTNDETQMLYDAMKNQMNRWLFKKDALYNNLTNTSYTRLVTRNDLESCCGGDITMPPTKPYGVCEKNTDHMFSAMDNEDSINTSREVKNRLAWAMFRTLPQEQMDNISQKGYEAYQKQWNKISNMTAAEFRELLKPENTDKRQQIEETSMMSVRQVVEYIDIVESVTGHDFDSDDWSINIRQFDEINEKVNGTYQEENDLTGKTRKDIPADRQDLLRYLEEHNLLLDQFKK